MFLLGVRVDHAAQAAFLVVMEKIIKNVRHHYTLRDARQVAAAECRDEIIAFYNNGTYSIRKRIYSQDWHPRKNVTARPTIVMAVGQDDASLVASLRDVDILIEAVVLSDVSGEALSGLTPARAGIGKSYPASEQMLQTTLSKVLQEKRLLTAAAADAGGDPLLTELERLVESCHREQSCQAPLLTAAAAPIWFRENVRYTSAYRASANSVRRFR